MDPSTMDEITIHYGSGSFNVQVLETHKVSDVIGAVKSMLDLPDHPTPYLTCKGVPINPEIPASTLLDTWGSEILKISYSGQDIGNACKVSMASNTEVRSDSLKYVVKDRQEVKVNKVIWCLRPIIQMDAPF